MVANHLFFHVALYKRAPTSKFKKRGFEPSQATTAMTAMELQGLEHGLTVAAVAQLHLIVGRPIAKL